MQTPDHWYKAPNWRARALQPVAALYATAARLKTRMTATQRATIPVVCVGNITAGGSGKTPVSIEVAKRLAKLGEKPAFLTRGYGGRVSGPVLVDAEQSRAIDVGDEPLLLARHFPTIVSANRPKGADMAAHAGASVIVMDDGYQNPSLHKDVGILVVDAQAGLGNGLQIPAGPLREPPQDALSRASALVIMGQGNGADAVQDIAAGLGIVSLNGKLTPRGDVSGWRGQQVLAFAGIGRPEKFFETLGSLGAVIREKQIFSDHHAYTDDEAQALLSRARDGKLTLATTEKDLARLSGAGHSGALAELRSLSHALPVGVTFDDTQTLDQVLSTRINAASQAGAYKAF